jgi:hypothetical protein
MTIRLSIFALAAIAAVTASSLAPADAARFRPGHFVRNSHHFVFATRPGVQPCRRGIVWVCQ